MKILVFGKSGQVARELARRGGVGVTCLDRAAADLCDPEACAALIAATDADVVINAAAYTAVDKAEAEAALAEVINGAAPAAMAAAAARRNIPFLHISTDYVFDGSGDTPWRSDDPTGPVSAYGRTKLAGEAGVRAAGGVHAILRTAWVFSAHGNNFVKTMLRLGGERDALSIVNDQIGGPTAAGDIAAALLNMAAQFQRGQGISGIYHFSGAPDVSWADFAGEIFRQAGLGVAISGIASKDYPTPAERPKNSRLDCSALARDYGIRRPDWRDALARVLQELAT